MTSRLKSAAAGVLSVTAFACAHVRPGVPALFPVTTIWTAALEDPIEGPLATDGTRVFVATSAGIRAYDAAGAVSWQIAGAAATGTLAAAQGVLIVHGADGVVSSLDPADGASRWRAETPVGGGLPPVIDGDRVLVAGRGLTALD